METAVSALNALLMIVLPLALGACLARRYRVPASLFGWRAVTFIGAQLMALESVLACFGAASIAIVLALRPTPEPVRR